MEHLRTQEYTRFSSFFLSNPCFSVSVAATRATPGMLKTLAILSAAIVEISTVAKEYLKPYWESEKSFVTSSQTCRGISGSYKRNIW